MVVILVVPVEEASAEGSGILDTTEALGESGLNRAGFAGGCLV
jgi:hypothetical protein